MTRKTPISILLRIEILFNVLSKFPVYHRHTEEKTLNSNSTLENPWKLGTRIAIAGEPNGKHENVPVIRVSLRRDRKRLRANIAWTIGLLDQAHCVRNRARTSRSEEYQTWSITIRRNGAVLSRNRIVHHRRCQNLLRCVYILEYSGEGGISSLKVKQVTEEGCRWRKGYERINKYTNGFSLLGNLVMLKVEKWPIYPVMLYTDPLRLCTRDLC